MVKLQALSNYLVKRSELFLLFLLFFNLTLGLYNYHCISSKENIEILRLKDTMALFVTQAARRNLSESQRKVLSQNFSASLKKAIGIYSKKHHAVLVIKPAVVAGAKDATIEVQNLVARLMRRGGKNAN